MPSTTIKYFAFAHLPPKLQAVSKPIGELAEKREALLPDGPEKSAGMRKLLEAKDCFVRCALEIPETTQDKLIAHATGTAPGFEVPVSVPPHQARVIKENADRDGEISRLAAFIDSNPAFPQLPSDEQARLRDELARPVLTDADAAADRAGTPRPENPTADAADFLASVKACDLSGDAPCEACQ